MASSSVLLRHREILSSSSSSSVMSWRGSGSQWHNSDRCRMCIFLCEGFVSSHVPGALQAMAVLITHFMYSTALDYRE